jgi:hypothetical protein
MRSVHTDHLRPGTAGDGSSAYKKAIQEALNRAKSWVMESILKTGRGGVIGNELVMRRKRKYRISVVPLSTLERDPKSVTVIFSAVSLLSWTSMFIIG